MEIGGGFRVPEIMAESGCTLVEVGTTNRTRRTDYERALTVDTALMLKVHASNYRMVGFTETAAVEDLADLGPAVMVDAGSGLLDETTPWLPDRPEWLRDEPGMRQAIEAGAGIVTFSGDKLLGGPQAGVIVGRPDLVASDREAPARPGHARGQDDARRAAASGTRCTSPATRPRFRCGRWRRPSRRRAPARARSPSR